ncbi:diguanylate cyclase [Qipengyuania sp.]|uniref:GGDEF domain-containing protein n=1 Tax=Qipengyuania sp. TaxID=2004515 RepID=UPI0035C7A242
MGNLRLIVLAALAIATVTWFSMAPPAPPRAYSLVEESCSGGAATAADALAIPESHLDCGGDRFDRRERFVRSRSYVQRMGELPPGEIVLQTDPTSFDSMLVRFGYADGKANTVTVDTQMTARNWDANGNFWIPVPESTSPLATIDLVVERPQSSAVFERMELVGFEAASRLNYIHTLLYILICGLLMGPMVYDVLFYRVLKTQFIIWHMIMTAGTLVYVLFNSGLVLLIWPEFPNQIRFPLIFIAISMAVVSLVRFSLLILEPGAVPARIARFLSAAALANLSLAVVMLFDFEILRGRIIDMYLISVLPVIAMAIAMLSTAIRRGSRVASFLTVAYFGFVVAGLMQVVSSLSGYPFFSILDNTIYCALVVLVIGTSAAVGDRFMIIKAERDRAHLRAQQLDTMANTDGLTGLLNRRAFDQHRRLPSGRALLLADIDRFKAVNDTYGHQRGDGVLIRAARILEKSAGKRGECQVYRLGGEEFAVVCRAETETAMENAAERLRAAIEKGGENNGAPDMPPITISIGAVIGYGQLMHVAYSDADQALYRAKAAGRNRVVIVEADSVPIT